MNWDKVVYRSKKRHFYLKKETYLFSFQVFRKENIPAHLTDEMYQLHSSDKIVRTNKETQTIENFIFSYNKEKDNFIIKKEDAMIYFNQSIQCSEEGQIWSAQNGATRKTLVFISKMTFPETLKVSGKLGFLEKGNHAFIFLNEGYEEKTKGVFLCSAYGYSVIEGEELFTASSCGGYGNSESRFGIYSEGTLIKKHTYKNRNTASFYRLEKEGWKDIPIEEVYKDEIQAV